MNVTSKFKASTIGPSIELVEVVSETAAFVTVKGGFGGTHREKKSASWYAFFKSFDEAKQWLMADAENRVKSARLRLEKEKGRLGNIKGMKEQA